MTLGRCPLSIFCSRGTPPRAVPQPTLSLATHPGKRSVSVLKQAYLIQHLRAVLPCLFLCFNICADTKMALFAGAVRGRKAKHHAQEQLLRGQVRRGEPPFIRLLTFQSPHLHSLASSPFSRLISSAKTVGSLISRRQTKTSSTRWPSLSFTITP